MLSRPSISIPASSSMENTDTQLTPKKLSIETKDQRRLVEYFLVVSSVEQSDPDRDSGIRQRNDTHGDAAAAPDPSIATPTGLSTPRIPAYANEPTSPRSKLRDRNFLPVITSRYPLHDHPDNPLSENVTCFCYPTGCIVPKEEFSMPKVSVVVHAEKSVSLMSD